jgi:hypothetical protein
MTVLYKKEEGLAEGVGCHLLLLLFKIELSFLSSIIVWYPYSMQLSSARPEILSGDSQTLRIE